MALATDLSYVMAGMDATIGIYRASNGTLIYGPYTADSFFHPSSTLATRSAIRR